jgi:hypothetical protein
MAASGMLHRATDNENVRLSRKIGSDRRTVKTTRLTQSGSRSRALVRLVASDPGHPPSPDIARSSGGPGSSRVGRSVRGDVVDLVARDTYILELPVFQAVQNRSQPLAFAPFLKRIPISPEKAGDGPRRCGGLSQPCCPIGRAHRGISWVLFLPGPGCRDMGGRA